MHPVVNGKPRKCFKLGENTITVVLQSSHSLEVGRVAWRLKTKAKGFMKRTLRWSRWQMITGWTKAQLWGKSIGMNKRETYKGEWDRTGPESEKQEAHRENLITATKTEEAVERGVTAVRSHWKAKQFEDWKKSIGCVNEEPIVDFVRDV